MILVQERKTKKEYKNVGLTGTAFQHRYFLVISWPVIRAQFYLNSHNAYSPHPKSIDFDREFAKKFMLK